MTDSPLKRKLESCSEGPFHTTDMSIGHRGACLQFPEETRESLSAAARMGAGILECDVVFTKDKKLVCRHAQCDLHTTTNILATPLAAKCTKPFTPASGTTPASAKCCTSDITEAEFKSLCGKMDGFNAKAATVAEYMDGTPAFRTDLYSTCGSVLTVPEWIQLVDGFGLKFTPELKTPEVAMPFPDSSSTYTQAVYAQQLIDEFKKARIPSSRVFPQSFLIDDLYYWLKAEPAFGKQALFLDEPNASPFGYEAAVANLTNYKKSGIRTVAPSIPGVLSLDANNKIIPSKYALEAKRLGLDIVVWSFERSGPLATVEATGEHYYGTIAKGVHQDGDMMVALDVMVREVGVRGVFSDWPATVTYYANCFRK
ncbi:PLC-like phosphodiesterase [Amylocarpus encephaloides]|uniref:glycerophosphodiester phosphodiesterase n=1 Tax=Amylocarpus encephaloides TaxID=45428 RepID=A0A9P8C4F8_9HELO|nr:PLC-like phosphodiesterase [Amylocarpus encephaloides]